MFFKKRKIISGLKSHTARRYFCAPKIPRILSNQRRCHFVAVHQSCGILWYELKLICLNFQNLSKNQCLLYHSFWRSWRSHIAANYSRSRFSTTRINNRYGFGNEAVWKIWVWNWIIVKSKNHQKIEGTIIDINDNM